MLKIEEFGVYSRREAEEMLDEVGITLAALFERFGARCTFRNVVLGTELIAIFRAAGTRVSGQVRPPGNEGEEPTARKNFHYVEPIAIRPPSRSRAGETVHERWRQMQANRTSSSGASIASNDNKKRNKKTVT